LGSEQPTLERLKGLLEVMTPAKEWDRLLVWADILVFTAAVAPSSGAEKSAVRSIGLFVEHPIAD
jgi:hypothetical protein